MNLKRGIFFGLMLMISSIQGICKVYSMGNGDVSWFYLLTLLLGGIQLIASFNYQKPLKIKILLLCFCLEGIYYIVSIVYLLIRNVRLEEKILGGIIGIIILTVIVSSIHTIFIVKDSRF